VHQQQKQRHHMQLAEKQMEQKPLKIEPSFDIWQLGIMIYEAMKGSYWPLDAKDAVILHTLATATAKLPHEVKPLDQSNMNDMMRVLMARDPAARPSAEELRKVLEDHDNTGTLASASSPWLDKLQS
jgi:serine/threonine protein kinase